MPENRTSYVIPCHDIVNIVEFSPFEWSCHLLAIGTSTRITVGSCKFQVTMRLTVTPEDVEIATVLYWSASEFRQPSEVRHLP